jgi:predicted ATP-dependent endonuclease of OLD family
MNITSLKLQDFRSFVSFDAIQFSNINVLVGANNSGKSTILKAIHLLQTGGTDVYADIRKGASHSVIELGFDNINNASGWPTGLNGHGVATLQLQVNQSLTFTLSMQNGINSAVGQVPNAEPHNLVVPFLSKRKTVSYNEDIRKQYSVAVESNMGNLAAKVFKVSNPAFPKYEYYKRACEEILGFVVTSVSSDNGHRAAAYLPNSETLFIDQMGEGVANIVFLLSNLAVSENKIFLIEELENDLHPRALKALLDLIIESAKTNQFFISTHSNIVVRHLAAEAESKLFNITVEENSNPPKAKIAEVERTPEARLSVLRDLGYSFSDFELWDGWLILEEASAELIIRDYLIPWFTPKLSRIRTLSTAGVTNIQPTFEDFHRLVRFTHLEEAYKNKAWVLVDGDASGKEIVKKLQTTYKSWHSNQFQCFSHAQFEHYYPDFFADEVKKTFEITDKKAQRDAKWELLKNVKAWLEEDKSRGKAALKESAKEIITHLKEIEKTLT